MSDAEDGEDETYTFDDITFSAAVKRSRIDVFKSNFKRIATPVARQFLCLCSVLMFPILSGFYEAARTKLKTPYDISNEAMLDEEYHAKLVAFSAYATRVSIVGILTAAILTSSIGRKYAVIVTNLLHLMTLLISYSNAGGIRIKSPSKAKLPVGLALLHVAVKDLGLLTYFIYLAEITSPHLRAFFLGLYFLIEALVDKGTKSGLHQLMNINLMFQILAALTGVTLLLAMYVPETPFWHMLKSRREKARESFMWLRASMQDTYEYGQMTDRAEDVRKGIKAVLTKHVLSQTFVVGMIYTIFIVVCTFNPCSVMKTFLNDFHVPYHIEISENTLLALIRLTQAMAGHQDEHRINGLLIFLVTSFVVPRKWLFLASHALGILITAIVVWKLGSLDLSVHVSSYCSFSPAIGITALSMILPVEYFPAALRNIGLSITAILLRVYKHYYLELSVRPRETFFRGWVPGWISYITYYGSLFAILFILVFMPETMDINLYQLDTLHLQLPFMGLLRRLVCEREGAVSEGEGAVSASEDAVSEEEDAKIPWPSD